MNKETDEKIIGELLDELFNLNENGKLVFTGISEKNQFFFKYHIKNHKGFKDRKKCIYPKCNNTSIKKSHSIQRSSSLTAIAENNHVLQPLPEERCGSSKIIMKQIGIKDASTFPGFCEEHENIFSVFEKQGMIGSDEHAKLQVFRNICREIVFREHQSAWMKDSLEEYKKLQKKKSLDFLLQAMKERGVTQGINNLELELNDDFIIITEGLINYLEQVLKTLRKYFEYIYSDISGNKESDSIIVKALTIDFVFPISLCGIANVLIDNHGEKQNVFVIMNVLPSAKSTTIICSTLQEYKSVMESYWRYYTQNPISMLNMIESFMINGSDHWFIKPSVWNSIPPDKKEIILTDLLHSHNSFFDQYPLSIFDDIRKEFIKHLEVQNSILYSDDIRDLIKQEYRKFSLKNHPGILNKKEIINEILKDILIY